MRKRWISLLLAAVLLIGLSAPAVAASETPEVMAQELYALGLLKGSGTLADGSPDFDLDSPATRETAATMLIRLMGKEAKAEAQKNAGAIQCPFTDVSGWAQANVTWLYLNNYVNGTGGNHYSGSDSVTAQQFAAMALRCLGYSEAEGDYTFAGALDFAVNKGLLTGEERSRYETSFGRRGMVVMCYNALYTTMKDSRLTLKEKLTNDGVFKASHTTLSNAAPLKLTEKYKGSGSYDPWSIELFRSCSPVAVDINKDGAMELLYSGLSLYCADAATGTVLWKCNTGKDRNTPWVAWGSSQYTDLTLQVQDIDGDGNLEIVNITTANGVSTISVYDNNGYFKPGWPQTIDKKVYALHITDLDNDGRSELCVGLGTGDSNIPSLYVYEPDGSIRSGWPKACGYGLYADSINSLDMNGDGKKDLVLLYDDQFVCAFTGDGTPIQATGGIYSGLEWGGIPVCETMEYESKCVDWAREHGGYTFASGNHVLGDTREERYCIVGTYSGIAVDDLDGDGRQELACTGLMVDGSKLMRNGANTYDGVGKYFTTFILNADRTRYQNLAKGFDWTQMPTDPGKIITFDASPNNVPVVGDVDGDGNKEIIYSSTDGMVHCWNLDGTEHGAWPYNLNPRGSAAITLATRPTCADVNGDGKAEVICGTYVMGTQLEVRGRLMVLDGSGKVLAQTDMPVMWGTKEDTAAYGANVCTAQPCVADLDGDGKLEIAVTTMTCGIVAYEIGG